MEMACVQPGTLSILARSLIHLKGSRQLVFGVAIVMRSTISSKISRKERFLEIATNKSKLIWFVWCLKEDEFRNEENKDSSSPFIAELDCRHFHFPNTKDKISSHKLEALGWEVLLHAGNAPDLCLPDVFQLALDGQTLVEHRSGFFAAVHIGSLTGLLQNGNLYLRMVSINSGKIEKCVVSCGAYLNTSPVIRASLSCFQKFVHFIRGICSIRFASLSWRRQMMLFVKRVWLVGRWNENWHLSMIWDGLYKEKASF